MSLTEVGLALGLIAGISGAIGTFLGGFLADKLGARDARWYLWIPIIGGLGSLLPAYYTLLGNNKILIIAAMVPVQEIPSSIAARHIIACAKNDLVVAAAA